MVTMLLPNGYKYLVEEEKMWSASNYGCKLRIRGIKTEADVRKWIDLLQQISLVTWKILRTYPNSGKINLYKGEFRCQHQVLGKRKDLKKTKNTNCPAFLRICIRRYLKSSNAKSPDPLNRLWPCIVHLNNIHNHAVESADSLQYRPVNDATRKKIWDLFEKGYSPSAVSDFLRLDLLIQNPELYEEREKDASFCPLPGFCYREYSRMTGCNYRGRQKNTIQMELETLISPYISSNGGGRAVISSINESLVVCICTPIMQRLHSNLSADTQKVVYLHAIGHPDRKVRIFLLSTWIEIGEVALGVIMTDNETPEIFSTGIQLLKTILPPSSFFGVGWPEVLVMADDDKKRKFYLNKFFDQSIILISKRHFQRDFLTFIEDPKHEIPKKYHADIYRKFKLMLNSNSDEELIRNFERIPISMIRTDDGVIVGEPSQENLSITVTVHHIHLVPYLNSLWKDTFGFTTVFRPGIFESPLQSSTSEGVENLSRIILNHVFQRLKPFNLVQCVHFIIGNFEEFVSYRLTKPNYADSLLKIFLPPRGQLNLAKIKKAGEVFFEVPCDEPNQTSRWVDMDLLRCSCGRPTICRHQSAIIHKYYAPTIPYPFHLQNSYFQLAGQESLKAPTVKLPSAAYSVSTPKLHKSLSFMEDFPMMYEQTNEYEEGNLIISDMKDWLTNLLLQNPKRILTGLRNLRSRIETIGMSEDEAVSALSSFGADRKPLKVMNSLASSLPPSLAPPPVPMLSFNPPTLLQPHDPSQHETSVQMTSAVVEPPEPKHLLLTEFPNSTFIPLEQLHELDSQPSYFIVLTTDKSGTTTFPSISQGSEDEGVSLISGDLDDIIQSTPLQLQVEDIELTSSQHIPSVLKTRIKKDSPKKRNLEY